MRAIKLVALLVAVAVLGACASSPLDRVSVIGASVSAGVGASVQDGKERKAVDLADALAAAGAVKGEKGPRVGEVSSHADPMYFMNPGVMGEKQLKEALAESPGCIIALDDLFWHVYGVAKSDEVRLSRLDKRLKELEAVKVPLVIGDIPDMSSAQGMLTKAQIAPEAVRLEANTRIHAWAAGRANVALVEISGLVAGVKSGRVRIVDKELVGANARALIGPDRLHASAEGLAAVAVLVLDAVEQIRAREGVAKEPLPALETVQARLRPRQHESGSWMDLLNSAMELKRADDESQKVGIEIDQAVELAKAGKAQRVAEVLPNLWVRELRSRTMLSMGQYRREDVYRECQKAGVDVKSKMIPVRDSLVTAWAQGGTSHLAAEISILNGLLGEPRRDLEILRAGVMVEAAAVDGNTPALDQANRLLADSREDQLGELAALFANPVAAVGRDLKAYETMSANAAKKGSFTTERDVQERRSRSLRKAELLAMSLEQAGRTDEAGAVRIAAERTLGERPALGLRELWEAEKRMDPGAYREAYLRALRKHLGMEVGPGADLAPAWDTAYASQAGRIGDRATTDEALRLVREWRSRQTEAGARRRGIDFELTLEDALGMAPTMIDELATMRVDAEMRKSTNYLAYKVIEVAARRGNAAQAVVLFDDYKEWPERVTKELKQLEKDTGGSSWISNDAIKYMRVKDRVKELRSAAVCLRAAGRTEEARVLERKAEEMAWKEPGWVGK